MKTPFLITISPKHYIHRCPARIAQEASGSYCHSPACPDCRRELAGYEAWGENGHLQGTWTEKPTNEVLARHGSKYSTPTAYEFREHGFTYLAN